MSKDLFILLDSQFFVSNKSIFQSEVDSFFLSSFNKLEIIFCNKKILMMMKSKHLSIFIYNLP